MHMHIYTGRAPGWKPMERWTLLRKRAEAFQTAVEAEELMSSQFAPSTNGLREGQMEGGREEGREREREGGRDGEREAEAESKNASYSTSASSSSSLYNTSRSPRKKLGAADPLGEPVCFIEVNSTDTHVVYMYVCVYIYTYINIYIYMYVCIYIYIYAVGFIEVNSTDTHEVYLYMYIYACTVQHTASYCNTLQHTATCCNIHMYMYPCMHINHVKFWPFNETCRFSIRLINLKTCGLSGEAIANREISRFHELSMKSIPVARLVAHFFVKRIVCRHGYIYIYVCVYMYIERKGVCMDMYR